MSAKLFLTENRDTGPQRRVVQVARCGSCPAEHVFNVSTAAPGGQPDDVILRKLTTIHGWSSARGGRKLKCPACAGKKPATGLIRCAGAGCDAMLPVRAANPDRPTRGEVKGAMRARGWEPLYDDQPTCPVCADGQRSVRYLAKVRRIGMAAAEAEYHQRGKQAVRLAAKQGLTGRVVGTFADTLAQIRATAEAFTGGPEALDDILAEVAELDAAEEAARTTERNTTDMASADLPRQPTRDDKRAIMDKLNAVYADGTYTGQWSDKRVADDLKRPVAWVAEIRAEFFGDADVSEAELARAREHARAVHECRADLKTAAADLSAAMDKLAAAERIHAGIVARLDKLEGKETGK